MTITTTLNRIREHSPCESGWKKLLAGLGKTKADDEPLPFSKIIEINGLEDALWCCRVEPQHAKEWRLFAVWCARQVQHMMTDERSIAALDVAERFANGTATEKELAAAWDAARDAWAARSATGAARSAAWAAEVAAGAAARTTWADAGEAARSAAEEAWNAAWADAGEAAEVAAENAQTEKFSQIVS